MVIVPPYHALVIASHILLVLPVEVRDPFL